jgi:hypothetical protein
MFCFHQGRLQRFLGFFAFGVSVIKTFGTVEPIS